MAQAKTKVRKRRALHPAQSSSIARPRATIERRLDWGGVRIVIPPTTEVARILPGRRGSATRVPMDVRGFVPSRPSTVVTTWVKAQIEAKLGKHPFLQAALGERGKPASFDTAAHLVADSVFEAIPYELRSGSAWQLPEETLARGRGDCEDRATLLASALVAAGISPYNVRVALGSVAVRKASARPSRYAHAWVVYRSEQGTWTSLEPVASGADSELTFEYEPDYVFNGDHLWSMRAMVDARLRKRWNALDPRFHGEVHRNIILQAATIAGLPEPLCSRLARSFTEVVGQVIDEPDIRFRAYDPRDHFDSGFIDESWRAVLARLKRFYAGPLTDSDGIRAVCWAIHAIGDFYAHSTYAHFLRNERRPEVPYDPVARKPTLTYDYASDPVFSKVNLTSYATWWTPADFDRLARWGGRPISGRYSFSGDSKGVIERVTNSPDPALFPNDAARKFAGSLPHHDEIAVDEAGSDKSNKLYPVGTYASQFALRYGLAVQHAANALKAHPQLGALR